VQIRIDTNDSFVFEELDELLIPELDLRLGAWRRLYDTGCFAKPIHHSFGNRSFFHITNTFNIHDLHTLLI